MTIGARGKIQAGSACIAAVVRSAAGTEMIMAFSNSGT